MTKQIKQIKAHLVNGEVLETAVLTDKDREGWTKDENGRDTDIDPTDTEAIQDLFIDIIRAPATDKGQINIELANGSWIVAPLRSILYVEFVYEEIP